jgi:uncharacterized membrane protein YjgN (DUF898 family)
MAGTVERHVRPEFTGSTREYFRIWIVNLFFTLITLGIYSAWAKVRKKRYFYGSLRLDGDTFDYFASPKTILKGRIVAVALFVIYAFSSEIWPVSTYGFWLVFLLVLPWLVTRALAFNARNSGYRGIRFDFLATVREAARIYIFMPLVVLVSLGFAFPWLAARQKEFIVSHHAYGTSGFECKVPVGRFFGIYLLAGLMMIGVSVPTFGLMIGASFLRDLPESVAWLQFAVPTALMYLGYAAVYAYMQANTANVMWEGTRGPGVRFSCTLSARKLALIYVQNIVAVAVSAGLLIPWAVVRTLQYRLENFTMIVEEERVLEASPALDRVGATGQELGDIFNLDLGL